MPPVRGRYRAPVVNGQKQCTRCGWRPVERFRTVKGANGETYYRGPCKDCEALADDARWKGKRRAKALKQMRRYYDEHREAILEGRRTRRLTRALAKAAGRAQ